MPPLKTAEPIVVKAVMVLDFLSPEILLLMPDMLNLLITFSYNISITNVDRIIHTETYSKDNVDTADDVNCDIPEVEEAYNVYKCQDYCQEDHQ